MILKFAIIAVFFAVASCASASETIVCSIATIGKTFDGIPFEVKLSSSMTHEEILMALGLNMRMGKLSETVGVDGVSYYYQYRKSLVVIGQSLEGITVIYKQRNKEAVIWDLCKPKSTPNQLIQRTPDGAANP